MSNEHDLDLGGVQRCPCCRAPEVEADTPRTRYRCGSSDYDQRPGTFKPGDACVLGGERP